MVQELFSDGVSEIGLNGVTTGTSSVKPVHGARQVNWYPRAIGACTGGVVVFEHNKFSPTYTGTWAELDRVDFAATPMTDAEREPFSTPGDLGWVRSRISSAITGGGTYADRINGLRG